uniref:Uncharacterized protein n=1 Tax=Mycena chlorophos TaxID=658473 RepID=A0ABQ0LPZ7_MYCCL|nr:predicted protein [Mycena chlorophos]
MDKLPCLEHKPSRLFTLVALTSCSLDKRAPFGGSERGTTTRNAVERIARNAGTPASPPVSVLLSGIDADTGPCSLERVPRTCLVSGPLFVLTESHAVATKSSYSRPRSLLGYLDLPCRLHLPQDSAGEIVADPTSCSDGMRPPTDKVHALGMCVSQSTPPRQLRIHSASHSKAGIVAPLLPTRHWHHLKRRIVVTPPMHSRSSQNEERTGRAGTLSSSRKTGFRPAHRRYNCAEPRPPSTRHFNESARFPDVSVGRYRWPQTDSVARPTTMNNLVNLSLVVNGAGTVEDRVLEAGHVCRAGPPTEATASNAQSLAGLTLSRRLRLGCEPSEYAQPEKPARDPLGQTTTTIVPILIARLARYAKPDRAQRRGVMSGHDDRALPPVTFLHMVGPCPEYGDSYEDGEEMRGKQTDGRGGTSFLAMSSPCTSLAMRGTNLRLADLSFATLDEMYKRACSATRMDWRID